MPMHTLISVGGAMIVMVVVTTIASWFGRRKNKQADRSNAPQPYGFSAGNGGPQAYPGSPEYMAAGRTNGNQPVPVKRQRMLRIIPIIGWAFAVVGGILVVVALLSLLTSDPSLLGMGIFGFICLLFGIMFIAWYRNFYMEFDDMEVRWRSLWGRERRMAYHEIDVFKLGQSGNGITLTAKSIRGDKLAMSATIYDFTRLMRQVKYRLDYGNWAMRPLLEGEVGPENFVEQFNGVSVSGLARSVERNQVQAND
ncbi:MULTISPECIES: EGFR-like transmembrane domain-containing protein [Micrococcales]|uniref:EGFR-like transmembrane domain-containing protein n=1 Tax=Micrococcales TaxID=85006 RepID=UPI0004AA37F0|nr:MULTISPECIES: transmembrane domain-containing protein [Micrococcales]